MFKRTKYRALFHVGVVDGSVPQEEREDRNDGQVHDAGSQVRATVRRA